MSKSDLKDIIGYDLLRYQMGKKITLKVLLYCFFWYAIPDLKFTIVSRYYRRKNRLLFYFFYLWLRRLKVKYGIHISYRTKIGKGLYIDHFGGVVIHGDAEIGEFCNLSQGMTIGFLARGKNIGIPKIGDRVSIVPGAKILGRISIGDDVLIGANAIVIFDAPVHSVVAAPFRQLFPIKVQTYILPT